MHTNRRCSLPFRAIFFLIFVLLPVTLPVFGQESVKGKAAETATLQLMQMHRNYQQAGSEQKSQLLAQFTAMAVQRQQLLSSLVQTNPADVLRVAIPNDITQNMPASVRAHTEQSVTAQGVFEVLSEMQGTPERTTGTVLHHYLRTSTGRLGLHFASSAPTHLLTGSVVRVNGVQVNNDLALESGTSSTSLQTVAAASAPSASGAVSTLVILVNFQDHPTAQPWSPSTVQDMVFTKTSDWDLQNSFQHTWLTGAVAGWFTIPVSSTNCDTGSIKSDALSKAQSAGYNLSNYSHFIYLMSSSSGCSAWWGLATIGGSDVWVNGKYNIAVHVFAHEMGHNFGLYHAHTVDCGTQVLCSSGTFTDYGDGFDVMGQPSFNAPHFDTFHKEQLGWLNASGQPPITTVTSSGTYQLSPYEAQNDNPKALKILRSGSTDSYYYVEFRQPDGFDSFVSSYSDLLAGVVFHRASPSDANSSDLLDLTPTSPPSFGHPALIAGRSYTDATAGITITPTAVSTSGATVKVTIGTAACTRANPGVSISPLRSSYVLAGTPVNFKLTVKDNDSASCAPATFNLSDSVPSGWLGVWSTSGLSLSPGTSSSATLTVTSRAGTADGFYNVHVSATNSSSTSHTASVTATYVISAPATLSIKIKINPLVASSGETVSINISVLSGTSPKAGANVTLTVTLPGGSKQKTMTGATGSNGVASFSYKLNPHATPGTYQVHASTPSSGSTTIGASTTFTVK